MFESICKDVLFSFRFVLRLRTYIKNKTVSRCYAACQTIFLNSFSTSLFSFRLESYNGIFLTKTVWPILPISPYDVISFLYPFGQQDKKNRR